jgi:F0F1-type ATP synthase assembly protein I
MASSPGRSLVDPGEWSLSAHLLQRGSVQHIPQPRQLNQAFGEALARAFEFSATVAIFCLIGFGLDQWFDTTPLFLITLFVVVLIGQTVRIWYAYGAAMRTHEEARRQKVGRAGPGSVES